MEIANKSLLIIPVTCHMCGEEHIPFYSLQRRTMTTRTNIFGVYQYNEALPGKEFCNYNLIRVAICPHCYFSSGYTNDFISESSVKKNQSEPFDKGSIVDQWLASKSKRQDLVAPYRENLFSESRKIKQSLLAYSLALLSTKAILKTELVKKETSRDYSVELKAVSYMMIKAELLMSHNKSTEAVKIAKSALEKLQVISPFLRREAGIKAGYLMGMLGLYFEIPKIISESFIFLQQYDKRNKVKFGTEEHKAWVTSLQKFTEAYQSRDEFSHKNMNGFNKPFEY